MIGRMLHGHGQDARATIEVTMGVPQQLRLTPRPFASCDLPGFALLPRGIEELVAFLPAHHKAHLMDPQSPEPGRVAIAPIKDVTHLAPPAPCHLLQQGLLLLALLPSNSLVPTPPPRRRHLRHPAAAQKEQAFPLKASHTHRHSRPVEHPFAAARQAARSAGTHRAESFEVLAFRLFQHTAIPDAQWEVSALFHRFSTLFGLLPQHLFDHLRLPPLMLQRSLESLLAGFGMLWPTERTS